MHHKVKKTYLAVAFGMSLLIGTVTIPPLSYECCGWIHTHWQAVAGSKPISKPVVFWATKNTPQAALLTCAFQASQSKAAHLKYEQ